MNALHMIYCLQSFVNHHNMSMYGINALIPLHLTYNILAIGTLLFPWVSLYSFGEELWVEGIDAQSQHCYHHIIDFSCFVLGLDTPGLTQ